MISLKYDRSRVRLFVTAGIMVLIWQLPMGREILYPLTLLSTFVHEMGHGLTAMLLGNQFNEMAINADGSGLASWSGSPSRLNIALISAGGLVGPSVVGAMLLVLSRTTKGAHLMLLAMAVFMAFCALVWVRNFFGLVFVVGWAVTFAALSKIASKSAATFFLHVVAITLCLSIFSDVDYMFSQGAVVDGVLMPSDSAQIAQALLLPYWVWGAVVSVFSVTVMAIAILMATRKVPVAPKVQR